MSRAKPVAALVRVVGDDAFDIKLLARGLHARVSRNEPTCGEYITRDIGGVHAVDGNREDHFSRLEDGCHLANVGENVEFFNVNVGKLTRRVRKPIFRRDVNGAELAVRGGKLIQAVHGVSARLKDVVVNRKVFKD